MRVGAVRDPKVSWTMLTRVSGFDIASIGAMEPVALDLALARVRLLPKRTAFPWPAPLIAAPSRTFTEPTSMA
jgi:hypothetical protein